MIDFARLDSVPDHMRAHPDQVDEMRRNPGVGLRELARLVGREEEWE